MYQALMRYTFLLRLRFLVNKLFVSTRIIYYRLLGMQVGKGTTLGKIYSSWPNKVKIGNDSSINSHVFFTLDCPFNIDNEIIIGNNVFIGDLCKIHCKTQVIIGDNSLIASSSTLVDTGHGFDRNLRYNQQSNSSKPIVLENDVWIGTGCTILSGVTIGEGSAVGAGSLVNKSIPPYQIWAGSPAKFIRFRE